MQVELRITWGNVNFSGAFPAACTVPGLASVELSGRKPVVIVEILPKVIIMSLCASK